MKNYDLSNNYYFFDWLINQIGKSYYAIYNKTSKDKNVKLIPLLYELVNDYAINNNVSPISIMNYEIYYINYNGFIFSVFKHVSNTNYEYGCYANFLEKTSVSEYINFDDIRKNNAKKLTKEY